MKNQNYSPTELILHVDDDLLFSKVQKSSSSIGQYSGPYYFSDKQSVIPFKWEKETGIPKELESLPSNIVTSIIPTPTKLKPKHVTKHVSTKSCFFVKPMRSSKVRMTTKIKKKRVLMRSIIFLNRRNSFLRIVIQNIF
jgi:hypothetical protein